MKIAYYSVMQYIPCRLKKESLCIGVVIKSEEKIYVATKKNLQKVQNYFDLDENNVEYLKQFMENVVYRILKLDADEWVKYFISRANDIRFSEFCLCKFENDADIDKFIVKLFGDKNYEMKEGPSPFRGFNINVEDI